MGAERAAAADLILADTKFEFGTDAAGELYLIDEVLTPDSSRFWPKCGYAPGGPQPSFDKQFIRDYLDGLIGGQESATACFAGFGSEGDFEALHRGLSKVSALIFDRSASEFCSTEDVPTACILIHGSLAD